MPGWLGRASPLPRALGTVLDGIPAQSRPRLPLPLRLHFGGQILVLKHSCPPGVPGSQLCRQHPFCLSTHCLGTPSVPGLPEHLALRGSDWSLCPASPHRPSQPLPPSGSRPPWPPPAHYQSLCFLLCAQHSTVCPFSPREGVGCHFTVQGVGFSPLGTRVEPSRVGCPGARHRPGALAAPHPVSRRPCPSAPDAARGVLSWGWQWGLGNHTLWGPGQRSRPWW